MREVRREKEGHARCNGAKVRTSQRMGRSAIDEKSAHDTGGREGQTRYEVEQVDTQKSKQASGCRLSVRRMGAGERVRGGREAWPSKEEPEERRVEESMGRF